MAEAAQPKWEGKTSVELKGPKADQVWPLLEDFCGAQKWFPNMEICQQVEGVPKQPGLIRYVAAKSSPSSDGGDGNNIIWAKEKLVAIDPVGRWLSYEALDNNMGLRSYVAQMKVLPISGDDEAGCRVEWSFSSDPVEGRNYEDFVAYFESVLKFMVNKMEKALASSSQ